jgi:hypothetical protein
LKINTRLSYFIQSYLAHAHFLNLLFQVKNQVAQICIKVFAESYLDHIVNPRGMAKRASTPKDRKPLARTYLCP